MGPSLFKTGKILLADARRESLDAQLNVVRHVDCGAPVAAVVRVVLHRKASAQLVLLALP